MKKVFILICLTLLCMGAQAQNEDLRHEISVSYGFGSTSQLGEGLGEGIGLIFSETEYDDGSILGPISLEYYYHFNNPRLAVGGFLAYSKWDSNILNKKTQEKVGERKRSFWSVMPAVKWYWVNKNIFGLYSKGAVGVAYLSSSSKTTEKAQDMFEDDNSIHFMYQLSLIGVEFGGKFRGFAEAGVGEQGFLQAGIRYKF